MHFNRREQSLIGDLRDALASSLEVSDVLNAASPLLLRLIPAHYVALGTTRPGQPEQFDWLVANLPKAFFEAYDQMAPHDFVRKAVVAAPNIVLRDSEMISRRELEANMMYTRARDLGMPLQQVMAVMLHVDDAWQSGMALYRGERRPFTAREQRILQYLTPAFAHAVRNCRLFAKAERKGSLLEALLSLQSQAVLCVTAEGEEIARTATVATVLRKWFATSRHQLRELPPELRELLVQVRLEGDAESMPVSLRLRQSNEELVVRLFRIADAAEILWAFVLEEELRRPDAPLKWRKKLTQAEYEVVTAAAWGLSNKEIAGMRGRKEDTIKKQLAKATKALKVPDRKALIALAGRERDRQTPKRPSKLDR